MRLSRSLTDFDRAMRFRMAVWTACVLTALAGACSDSRTIARPTSPTAPRRSITHDDSLRLGYFAARPFAAPADPICSPSDPSCPQVVSADPGYFQGFDQPSAITLQLSGLVGSISVTGNGAIECDGGTYGTIVGYDSAGVELGRQDLSLIDPSDCSPPDNPDNVTFGAQGVLLTPRAMLRAVILPMTPLSFPVFDLTGHASATYTVNVGIGESCSPHQCCL